MKIDKILIGVGVLLGSILVIENMVSGYPAYLFLDTSADIGLTLLVAIFVGGLLGYGFRGMMIKKDNNSDDYDF